MQVEVRVAIVQVELHVHKDKGKGLPCAWPALRINARFFGTKYGPTCTSPSGISQTYHTCILPGAPLSQVDSAQFKTLSADFNQ